MSRTSHRREKQKDRRPRDEEKVSKRGQGFLDIGQKLELVRVEKDETPQWSRIVSKDSVRCEKLR